ncbi:MAG: hypothetical protein ABEJ28_03345 [Salinigranum sp.]
MTVDARLVAAGAGLLLASSALFLRTGVSGGVPLVLAAVAALGVTVAAIRSGTRGSV